MPRKKKKMMPNMQGAAVQCCMCITGVFMFLGGLIMLATGICLILNYGVFDVNLLPPDLQNEDGKKTVGIILTCCGLVAILISVIVSALYLCTKQKSATIDPDSLTRIPNTARNQTPDKPDTRDGRGRRLSGTNKTHPMPNGNQRQQSQTTTQKFTPGSAEVKHPRQSYPKRHKKRKYPRATGRRLEEIKEQDAISRKTIVEGALSQERDEDYADTLRSGSISSEMTLDDQTKIPKVSLDDYDNNQAPSETSSRMSQDSEFSQSKFQDNDKSRRELQFLPNRSTYESDFQGQYETVSIDSRLKDNFSINSDTTLTKGLVQDIALRDLGDTNSAGRITPLEGAVGYTPEIPDSDGGGSMASFKAIHRTEIHGDNTLGRISPQIGELESYTKFEIESRDKSYEEIQ